MTIWTYPAESGTGWEYNQQGITYNDTADELTGAVVYYNAVGIATAWTYTNRN